jgi:hypothetical protein
MTNQERSNRALFEAAILEGRPDDAKTYYDFMAEEYSGQLPTIFQFHAARIDFASGEVGSGLAKLQSWRKTDGSPFGTYLSVQALVNFRIKKELADIWFSELQSELEQYVPMSPDDLPNSHFEIQVKNLKNELAEWTAELS